MSGANTEPRYVSRFNELSLSGSSKLVAILLIVVLTFARKTPYQTPSQFKNKDS